MITKENYMIVEEQDILDAAENIKEAGAFMEKYLMKLNGDGKGEEDAAAYNADLTVVLAAAFVGAGMCSIQGGIIMASEKITSAEKQEAMELLKALRPKTNQQPVRNEGGVLQ